MSYFTVYEQRDIMTSILKKPHADYRDKVNWNTAKIKTIHRVVYSLKQLLALSVKKSVDNVYKALK